MTLLGNVGQGETGQCGQCSEKWPGFSMASYLLFKGWQSKATRDFNMAQWRVVVLDFL